MLREKYIGAKQKWAEKQKARGVVPRATASVFYSTGKNSTGVAGFSYSTSQAGMSLAYRF